MSSRLIVLPLAAATLFVLGATLPSHGQTQDQMTQEAQADFDKADAELTALYNQVLQAMSDETARKKLIHAQKAWGVFRDAQAELDADAARDGTLQPQIYALSEDSTTRARITQLKQLLKELQAK